MTASCIDVKALVRFSSKPSHNRGRVRVSGRRPVSWSMKASAIVNQMKIAAPSAVAVAPKRHAAYAAPIPARASTSGYLALMRARHAEHLPRSTSQLAIGTFSQARMRCPHDGHAERGATRLYGGSGGSG
jgi:hypothetical protein